MQQNTEIKSFFFFLMPPLTCVHAASELNEALEAEIGYLWGHPGACLWVKAVLTVPPVACVQHVVLLL